MPVQPAWRWKRLYLIFPPLKQSLRASKNLYKCGTFLVMKDACTTWRVSLLFSALKQRSTSIAQLPHFSKLNFSSFPVPKHDYTTTTGSPRQWKRLYLIFPALKQESTSIVQPLQLWKLYLWTFLVLKDACTTSTTVWITLCDLHSTDTGVLKHRTTSTVVGL